MKTAEKSNRLTDEIEQALKEYSAKENIPPSVVVNTALREYLGTGPDFRKSPAFFAAWLRDIPHGLDFDTKAEQEITLTLKMCATDWLWVAKGASAANMELEEFASFFLSEEMLDYVQDRQCRTTREDAVALQAGGSR